MEESGYEVKVTNLLGVYSSNRYKYINYPWKENQFCHIVFRAEVTGGKPKTSSETTAVAWFSETNLPPLSDGFDVRIKFGFQSAKDSGLKPFYE